jgi:formylglycine-generating enzyme required for sulfatase activity
MHFATTLVSFGLQQTLGVSAEGALGFVEHHLRDQSQALSRALARANDHAWKALSVALAGDGLLGQIKVFFSSGEVKGLREQIGRFLASSAAAFDRTPSELRRVCLAELHEARKAGRLSAQGLSAADVGRRVADFRRFADPGAVVQGSIAVVAEVADGLEPHHPNLARLLRRPTPEGMPLLVVAFLYFFRREVETDDTLARGLTFDNLRQIAAAQEQGFADVGEALSALGDRFDDALAQLGRVEAAVTETRSAAVSTHEAVMDMQAELHRLESVQQTGVEEVRRLVQEALACLPGRDNGAARPRSSILAPSPAPFTNSLGMRFVWVPPGSFRMGSPAGEHERRPDETPHTVTLTRGFYLGVHPVTQAQWRAVMDSMPSRFSGDDRPVERVSWEDCQAFCARMARLDGNPYRLPTEAGWEYGCRAGTTTPFHFGEALATDQANFDGNDVYRPGEKGEFRRETTAVGLFAANAWGLYDLHGNVFEWCSDWYGPYPDEDAVDPAGPAEGSFRVLRGGSWFSAPWYCRSAYRYWADPSFGDAHIGCRICFIPEA